jgi:cold shock CspA family protein
MRGTLKTWIEHRSFGFIFTDGRADMFVHIRELNRAGINAPEVGMALQLHHQQRQDVRQAMCRGRAVTRRTRDR